MDDSYDEAISTDDLADGGIYMVSFCTPTNATHTYANHSSSSILDLDALDQLSTQSPDLIDNRLLIDS
jgi:hypothetical protein